MNYKHGKRRTRAYSTWRNMMTRCYNTNYDAYPNYGGRGIVVCMEWHQFQKFYADMGDPPNGRSLDRVDNDGPYSKENCRWSDRKEQNRNRRSVRMLTVNGVKKSMAEWAETTGLELGTIHARIKKGWSIEDAVMMPKVTQRKGIPRGQKLNAFCAERGVKLTASEWEFA